MIKRALLLAGACAAFAMLFSGMLYQSGAPPTAGPELMKLSSYEDSPATTMAFLASIVPATEYRLAIPADVRSISLTTIGSGREQHTRVIPINPGDPPAVLSIIWAPGGGSGPSVKVDGVGF